MPKMLTKSCRDIIKEWDERAQGDWRRSVWAEASESEEAFRASGERDYGRHIRPFLSAQGINPGKLVALEIGAGVGRMSEFLCRNFHRLVAVDASREMLRIGRKRIAGGKVLWLCNDGKTLNAVADASVDFIFSHSVFQHIPRAEDVAVYVREAARVLKPGGSLVFQVMNQPHFSVGPWKVTLIVSHRFHVPRVRIHRGGGLEVYPIRIGAIRKACGESGLEIACILHRFTQNTWIWARKAAIQAEAGPVEARASRLAQTP
ncbi:MAG TPA: class I SAM-dependent methyltransferase [Terriglobia bacterium]|nr:class I SAM-dependent methyltransferase [Terriglobia bacterium]